MSSPSQLARLQRFIAIATLLAALACGAWLWPTSPLLAVIAGLAVAFWHAWILAAEFILMRIASRHDPAPSAGLLQLTRAWLSEVRDATVVFGWRQPFAWDRVADRCEAGNEAVGIVFVHGFVCNRGFWTPWMREAAARGHPYVAVNLEPVFCSIDDYCSTIDAAVDALTRSTGRAPLLVCHSMGGLAARAWLRACGGRGRVAHVVTIGTPHHGTWLARFSRLPNGRQMRMACEWITTLPACEPDAPRFTCWYSNCDNIVFPPSTATLAGADNRLLEGAAHVDLAFRPALMQHTFALARGL